MTFKEREENKGILALELLSQLWKNSLLYVPIAVYFVLYCHKRIEKCRGLHSSR